MTTHPAAQRYAAEHENGHLSRREFLTRATSLGVSATVAYGLIGLPTPARAQETPSKGGTLRMQGRVMGMKDPRTYDWPDLSNFSRGWLEYLTEYQRDGSITPMLLEGWEINDDATRYVLTARKAQWNNGDPFTAEDVAHNIERWCDTTVEGNAMASRMSALIDPETGKVADGVIEVLDEQRVALNLRKPDITLIASFSDYPAAVVHPSLDGNPLDNPIGTGPYLPLADEYQVGVKGVMVRNDDHAWWGYDVPEAGGAYLDRVEMIDLGGDQAAVVAAADSGEIDMNYESLDEFIDVFDAIGWQRSEAETSNTIVIRPNQNAVIGDQQPYADVRVRRALQLAVNNALILELGYGNNGTVAENHHVWPLHPEYAELPPIERDVDAARALMEEAGMMDFVHELVSLDDTWRKNTADAVAAQLRDAGFQVERTVLPGSSFWNDWTKYSFSVTNWAHRPLGVQSLALAYKSGQPWNETGFANEEFDRLLDEAMTIADADQRRELMRRIEEIMQNEGVTIQPYWRSTYRHAAEGLLNFEQHPAFEIHLPKIGWAA